MNILDLIREKALKFLRIDKLAEDPTSERLTYINDPDDINKQDMSEARVWYLGDSNELLNYYTNKQIYSNNDEPIYNRNRTNYFWGISSQEASIKRVHSGVPKAIVDTLTNVIDFPIITASFNGKELDTDKLIEKTELKRKTMQEQLPMTMAIGWGAWKIELNPALSDFPIIQYYEAKNVEFIAKQDKIIGLIFKDYYSYGGKDYVLFDTRRLDESGDSCVEYELFEIKRNKDCEPRDLGTIPELANLQDVKLPNYKHLLGVPCRFFHNPNNPNYGRSIYYGKYDLFDDLDQSLSQRSQTSRVSTPVEYYPTDILERNSSNGSPILPSVYNRQYVKKDSIPNGDGTVNDTIQTTQPVLNFEQYNTEQTAILGMILNGILSPATMGIDIAKKDNAEAQREKEKVTIMTRNNIISEESRILRELVSILWAMTAYMQTGSLPLDDLDVSVKYSEFANPSFESLSKTLLPLWQAGAMSDEFFVERLYGDSLSKKEKEQEIAILKANKKREDDLTLSAFGGDKENGQEMVDDMGDEEEESSLPEIGKRQLHR